MRDKIEFVINELWILAWGASVQRAKLYKNTKESSKSSIPRTIFRNDIIKFLTKKIIPQYVDGCTEEQHYMNIESIIAHANKADPGLLGSAGYKYGVAQKLLNLALKYYWCLDLISEPPHCPIDRIIISKTKYNGVINWTNITQKSEYDKIINEVRVLASRSGLSISQWELTFYSRR